MNLFAFLRQGLASVALTTVALTGLANAASLGFTDDAQIPSWADEAIEELMDQGVISGNDDGSFAPNRQLNRAEVSKVIVLATGVDMDTTGGPHFPDVTSDAWFYDYIETMYNEGWINGYPDGQFRPGVGINRAEIAKMVVNGFALDQDLSGAPHFDDVTAGDWFYGYVETVYNNGAMRGYGDGTFGPGNAVTRAETAKIVYDAQLVALGSFTGIAEGTLEIMLSNETPRGTNIPFNATSVPYTTVELTASDDADIEISSMTFTRLGLGDNDDFDNVWLEIDGFKVGNDKSVNNDDVVELRFNPPIVIPAGQTLIADIVSSMKFTATDKNVGHHNRFVLVSPDDIVSSADNIAGDFPIEGEEMEVADYEVTQLKFSALGSDTNIDVGDSFIEIGKFRMLNASDTNKDVELRAITFKNDGTAELEDDLENVGLYVSGEQISAETIIDGDYMTFRLDNGVTGGYIVEDGDSRIFSIRADVVSAEKDDLVNFKVDNFEDIVGVEIGTAFGVKAISDTGNGRSLTAPTTTDSGTSCTGEDAEDDCARLRAYLIEAGDLTISRDPSSLNNQEYAPGSNDVVFMTARLVVDQPIIVDGVTLNVKEVTSIADLATLNAYFDNFRLFLNDKLIDTENDFSGTAISDANLAFNTTFEIAGTSILKLVGNIQDDAVTGSSLRMEVRNTAFDSPEYISTGDQIESVLGSAEASFVEVEKSILTISRTDGFAATSEEIVAGVDDVSMLKFVLDNNDSGDVNVTSVTIDAVTAGAANANIQDFTAAIFVGGTQQGSSRNLDSDGKATFNDLSVVIDSASQKEFEVVFDTNTTAGGGNTASTTVASNFTPVSVSSAVPAGGTTITLSSVVGIVATDTIAVSADGTTTGSNAELKVVAGIVGNVVTVTTPFVNSHTTAEKATKTNVTYLAGTTTMTIADASNLSVGDTFTVAGTGPTASTGTVTIAASVALDTFTATVGANTTPAVVFNTNDILTAGDLATQIALLPGVASAVNGGTAVVTITSNTGAAGNLALSAAAVGTGTATASGATLTGGTDFTVSSLSGTSVTFTPALVATANVGDAVTETSLNSSFQVTVTTVVADNVENGQEVTVQEGGATLAVANPLLGATFSVLETGALKVELGSTVFSDILVANQTDVEILQIRLTASDDEIQVSDIYFQNDLDANLATQTVAEVDGGDRVTFKLYNEAGALVATETMVSGKLQFELGNTNRIRVPKDGNTTLSIRVDVRDINDQSQTGKQVSLALDTTAKENGTESVTAATGADLKLANVTATTVVGQNFIVLNSQMALRHAATQPAFADPSAAEQEFYRFTVSADAADEVEVEEVTLGIALQGMTYIAGTPVYRVLQVKTDGTLDNTSVVTNSVVGTGAKLVTDTTDTVVVNFDNQVVAAGESRTYALLFDGTVNSPGGLADDDSVSVTLLSDITQVGPAASAGLLAANNVVWSDESDVAGSDDFFNGFLIDQDTTAMVNQD